MLDERRDRPVSMLAAQESQQHTIAANFDPGQALPDPEREIQAQKMALDEVASKEGSGGWSVKLEYKSVTRTVAANGKGQNKKSAKKQAAHSLLNAIKFSVDPKKKINIGGNDVDQRVWGKTAFWPGPGEAESHEEETLERAAPAVGYKHSTMTGGAARPLGAADAARTPRASNHHRRRHRSHHDSPSSAAATSASRGKAARGKAGGIQLQGGGGQSSSRPREPMAEGRQPGPPSRGHSGSTHREEAARVEYRGGYEYGDGHGTAITEADGRRRRRGTRSTAPRPGPSGGGPATSSRPRPREPRPDPGERGEAV
ncbi:hypothetical protein THAOC_00359, partial [Thalassiosira oceanica]